MPVVTIANPNYTDIGEQKRLQIEDHDRTARSAPAEVESPDQPRRQSGNAVQDFVYEIKVNRILEVFGPDLQGRTVLGICAGMGEYGIRELVERGAHVTLTDLSPETVQRARQRWQKFPNMDFKVADAEALPFPDSSFDVVFCHAGLHHLPRPVQGIFEMYRVARQRAIFVEAQDSAMLRLLVKLKLAEDWEQSGNYVYRFSPRELHKVCASMGVRKYEVHTFFNQYSDFLNNRVYPFLNNGIGLMGFKAFYAAFNRVFGSQGNCFIASIWKNV